MSERLEWTVDAADGVTRVTFDGPVNEDSDFRPLVEELKRAEQLVFDTSGISRINSCGVREWAGFIRSLGTVELELEKCSPPVVNQINMISNFVGNGRVQSVLAPYVCVECGHEAQILVVTESQNGPVLPEQTCPSCEGEMEFDDLEESYFSFVGRR